MLEAEEGGWEKEEEGGRTGDGSLVFK